MMSTEMTLPRVKKCVLAALLMLAPGCSGGNAFTASDANAPSADDASEPTVISNPAGQGTQDATMLTDAETDAGADTAIPGCSAGELSCDGGCIPNDMNNCGACGSACTSPEAGTSTCGLGDAGYACQLTCAVSYTQCARDCVDLQSDPKNCGSCGHDCVGGACSTGQCQPWVIAQTTQGDYIPWGPAGARGLIVSDGVNAVWFDENSGIYQAPISGAGPTTILASMPSQKPIGGLAIANHVIAWTMDGANGTILVGTAIEGMANSGAVTASTQPAMGVTKSQGLALDATGTNAYFLWETPSLAVPATLQKCSLPNGSCTAEANTQLSASTMVPNDVAISGTNIFWTDSANGTVWHADYTRNILSEAFATGQPAPYLLAVDSQYVYWALAGVGVDAGTNNTMSISRAAQSTPLVVSTVLPTQQADLISLATDGTNVYLTGISTDYAAEQDASFNPYLTQYSPVGGAASPQGLPVGPVGSFALTYSSGLAVYIDAVHNTVNALRFP
jgi:hypothetical protein